MSEVVNAQQMEQELADLKRQDQGNFECEVWSSTAEGAGTWKSCKKNPGHPSFIPATEFTIEHLPEKYRDKRVFESIRYLADLTVRLTVGYTSMDRPDGYAFAKYRGKRITHTGSGCVHRVEISLEKHLNNEDCPCPECVSSGTRKKDWWNVNVLTAKHVIFCNEEVKNTRFDLFYDDENSEVKHVYGHRLWNQNFDDDRCEIICVTHDKTLADRLSNAVRMYLQLHRELCNKGYASLHKERTNLGVVISHPHGCSKYITIGEWVDCIKGKNCKDNTVCLGTQMKYTRYLSYTYDMSTCPGSSGGPVIIMGMWEENWTQIVVIKCHYYFCHTHMSGNVNGGTLNQSSMIGLVALGHDLPLPKTFFDMTEESRIANRLPLYDDHGAGHSSRNLEESHCTVQDSSEHAPAQHTLQSEKDING